MLTREQLLDYIDKNYDFYLMDYQKTALWELYKRGMTERNFASTYGRENEKMFIYQIVKELMEYKHQRNNGIDK